MAQFNSMKLTNKGILLMNKVQSGIPLNFTKISTGDGYLADGQSLENLTSLINKKLDLNIIGIESSNGTAKIKTSLSNQDLIEGIFVREIGLFAQDPDEGEILYSVANAGNTADFIPPKGKDIIENLIDLVTKTGNASSVTASIDKSLIFTTVADFEETKGTIGDMSKVTGATNVVDKLVQHETVLADMTINIKHPPIPLIGAKGDFDTNSKTGTDDTTAIQNIINSIPSGFIYFPKGTYLITQDLIINNKTNLTIFGNGDSTIYNRGGNYSFKINGDNFGDIRYVSITGIVFSGDNISQIADIYINNSFRFFHISKNRMNSLATYGVFVNSCINGLIENNEINGNKRKSGIYLYGAGTVSGTTQIVVSNNNIWSDAPYGGDDTNPTSYMQYGIELHAVQECKLINNNTEGVSVAHIYLHSDLDLTQYQHCVRNKIITHYGEKGQYGVKIDNGGNTNEIISAGFTNGTNPNNANPTIDILINDSESKLTGGSFNSITLGANSQRCFILRPYLSALNGLSNLGSNNQGIYGVDKTLHFLNRIAIHNDSEVTFEDNLGVFKGEISHTGSNMEVTSTGNILIKRNGSATGKFIGTFEGGTTRPTTSLVTGFSFFDTNIGKPIWWNGTVWKDATGTTV